MSLIKKVSQKFIVADCGILYINWGYLMLDKWWETIQESAQYYS
ncbi:MAG: hypothetical protein PHF89_06960 [Eubacteriales bacterium]|nr:hypothetical protein [Eubacteriales bacterium]